MSESLSLYRDAAKRCSDAIKYFIALGETGKWVAIRLRDGGNDGVAYDSRLEAIKYQLHERQCMYVQIPHDDMPIEDAAALLSLHRKVYDAGYRFCDPDGPELILPGTQEGILAALRNPHLLKVGNRGN